MARRRLCTQADPTTRAVMQEICKQAIATNPEFEGTLEPMCSYRGGRCTEFNCCGANKQYLPSKIYEAQREDTKYWVGGEDSKKEE